MATFAGHSTTYECSTSSIEVDAQPRPQTSSKRERKMIADSPPKKDDCNQRRKDEKKAIAAGGKQNVSCKFWQQGSCRSGDCCKFAHVDATEYARGETSGVLGPQIAEVGEITFGGGGMD